MTVCSPRLQPPRGTSRHAPSTSQDEAPFQTKGSWARTHARMHSLTHALTHSDALTHSLTHARTHALTHSSPTRMRARTLVCAHVLPNWSVCLRSQSSCRCCSTARCGSTRTWAGPLPPAFISTAHVPRRCLSLRCADGSAPLAALRQYILQARPTDVASVYDGRRG